MARIEGVDPKQTSFLMRQVFKGLRKMLGRDLIRRKSRRECREIFGRRFEPNGCSDKKLLYNNDCGRSCYW